MFCLPEIAVGKSLLLRRGGENSENFLTGWFNDPELEHAAKFLTHKNHEDKSFENRRTHQFFKIYDF